MGVGRFYQQHSLGFQAKAPISKEAAQAFVIEQPQSRSFVRTRSPPLHAKAAGPLCIRRISGSAEAERANSLAMSRESKIPESGPGHFTPKSLGCCPLGLLLPCQHVTIVRAFPCYHLSHKEI